MRNTDVPRKCKQTADIIADKLMRLRSNRVLYDVPPAYAGIGRQECPRS